MGGGGWDGVDTELWCEVDGAYKNGGIYGFDGDREGCVAWTALGIVRHV